MVTLNPNLVNAIYKQEIGDERKVKSANNLLLNSLFIFISFIIIRLT